MTAFRDIAVQTLLPQQPPFRFVDFLEHYDEVCTRTSFTVSAQTMMLEDGHLSAAALLEHMAQSCAARTGYYTVYILHKTLSVGYIGQVRHYRIERLPAVGERLETQVCLKQSVFGISQFDVTVRCQDQPIAWADMKMAVPDA